LVGRSLKIIQEVPNLSRSIANRDAKKVSCSGLKTSPPALRPLDLTNGQFSLLMSLNRPQAPSMGAVASLLAMDRTTPTAALKPLERRGLIKVTTDRLDRRSRLIRLTAKGRSLLARAVPTWESTHREVEGLLSGSPDRLRKDLRALL
jgi:DNA-binding MarR family transcriptional regulator